MVTYIYSSIKGEKQIVVYRKNSSCTFNFCVKLFSNCFTKQRFVNVNIHKETNTLDSSPCLKAKPVLILLKGRVQLEAFVAPTVPFNACIVFSLVSACFCCYFIASWFIALRKVCKYLERTRKHELVLWKSWGVCPVSDRVKCFRSAVVSSLVSITAAFQVCGPFNSWALRQSLTMDSHRRK